jgi:hypothetical protein
MSGGTEDRKKIIPAVQPEDTGFVLPKYSYADSLRTPNEIGVRSGGSIGDVVDAARGVMYYADVIGFAKSSGFSRGPFDVLGINYFVKTGLTCDNGADMWMYFEGIPKGNALGKKIQSVADRMGLSLKGLAPGMIEDMKAGLDPTPILQATFGSAYPKCVQVTKPVGDINGNLGDSESKWIKGDITYVNGKPAQTRWIQATTNGREEPIYMDRGEYDKTPKTMKPDGTPIPPPPPVEEDFQNGQKASLLLAVVFLCSAMILKSL